MTAISKMGPDSDAHVLQAANLVPKVTDVRKQMSTPRPRKPNSQKSLKRVHSNSSEFGTNKRLRLLIVDEDNDNDDIANKNESYDAGDDDHSDDILERNNDNSGNNIDDGNVLNFLGNDIVDNSSKTVIKSSENILFTIEQNRTYQEKANSLELFENTDPAMFELATVRRKSKNHSGSHLGTMNNLNVDINDHINLDEESEYLDVSDKESSSWIPSGEHYDDEDDATIGEELIISKSTNRRGCLTGLKKSRKNTKSSSSHHKLHNSSNNLGNSSNLTVNKCLKENSINTSEKMLEDAKQSQNSIDSCLEGDNNSDSDDYCWICHKVGKVVICSYCPRVFHPQCLCTNDFPDTWLCPECQDLTLAECLSYRSSAWEKITKYNLKCMLLFLIDRLSRQNWAQHFREPVDTEQVPGYKDIISYPMDLRTLYKRIMSGQYASAQAFLGDFRWIVHNCIIFNGGVSALTSSVRLLDRTCNRELNLMRACPKCYLNRMSAINILPCTSKKLPPLTEELPTLYLSKFDINETDLDVIGSNRNDSKHPSDRWWFCRLCDIVHPLVWIRLQDYPRWPAKVMGYDGDCLLVSFFGDYDVTLAPIGSAQLLSISCMKRLKKLVHFNQTTLPSDNSNEKNLSLTVDNNDKNFDSNSNNKQSVLNPVHSNSNLLNKLNNSINDPNIEANYIQAIQELNYHINLICSQYSDFQLPAQKLDFSKRHVERYYGRFKTVKPDHTTDSDLNSHKFSIPHESSNNQLCESVSNNADSECSSTTRIETKPPSEFSSSTDLYFEPVLTRVAASLKDSNSPVISFSKTDKSTISDDNDSKKIRKLQYSNVPNSSVISDSNVDDELMTMPSPSTTAAKSTTSTNESEQIIVLQPDSSSTEALCPVQFDPFPLHRIPEDNLVSPVIDEINEAFNNVRSQFNVALMKLEEKWQNLQSNLGKQELCARKISCSNANTQTDPSLPLDKTSNQSCDTKSNNSTDSTDKQLEKLRNNFHRRMMETEIMRLDQENQRLNLLLSYTRAEMSLEMNRRVTELRRVWNFEVSAILEAASKIWEQDVIRIVDSVKRKQWCAYCGSVAYYYCCWNTSYCNNICQSKHWASHIVTCVQARSQMNGLQNRLFNLETGSAISTNSQPLSSVLASRLNSSSVSTVNVLNTPVIPNSNNNQTGFGNMMNYPVIIPKVSGNKTN